MRNCIGRCCQRRSSRCAQVQYVSTAEIPAEVLERERAIEMEKADILQKPAAMRPQIVAGRVNKLAKEWALLETPFIKDTSKSVQQVRL